MGILHDQSYVQCELVKVGTYETHPAMFVLFKVILAIKQLDMFIFDAYFTTPKPNVVMKVKQKGELTLGCLRVDVLTLLGRGTAAGKRSGISCRTLTRKTMEVLHQTHLRGSVFRSRLYQSIEDYKNDLLLGHITPAEAGQPVVVAAGPKKVQGRTSNVQRETDFHVDVDPSVPTPLGALEIGSVGKTFREVHPDTPGGVISTAIHDWGIRVLLRAGNIEGWQYPHEFSIGVVIQHSGPVDVLVVPAAELVERLKPELAIVHRLRDDMQGSEYPTCAQTSEQARFCNDTCNEFGHTHMSATIWKDYLAEHWLKDWDLAANNNVSCSHWVHKLTTKGWVHYGHRVVPEQLAQKKDKAPEKKKTDCIIA